MTHKIERGNTSHRLEELTEKKFKVTGTFSQVIVTGEQEAKQLAQKINEVKGLTVRFGQTAIEGESFYQVTIDKNPSDISYALSNHQPEAGLT